MGLVDLFTRNRPPRTAALTSGGSAPSTDVLAVQTSGQDLARRYATEIGIIRGANDIAARLAAACTLRVEYLQPDGRTWLPADDLDTRDHAAEIALGTWRDEGGSQQRLVYRHFVLRQGPGEAWNVQVPRADNPERFTWQVVDPVAVLRPRNDTEPFTILRTRGGNVHRGTAWRLSRDRVQRTWRPDPSFDLEATSPMWGILRECGQLIDGDRATSKRFRSRIVGGTILHFPAAAMNDPVIDARPGGPQWVLEKRLLDWANSNAATINDNTVGSVAPFITWYGDDKTPEPKVVPLGETIDQHWPGYRRDLLEAIAQGLPYPTYLTLEGPGAGGNRWGDWLADDKVTEYVTHELAEICENLTVGIFRPMLRRLADRELLRTDPEKMRVGFDPSRITQQPDNSDLVIRLLELGVVGYDTVLREVGLSQEDLATEGERRAILEFVRGLRVDVDGVAARRAPDRADDMAARPASAAPVEDPALQVIAEAIVAQQQSTAAAVEPATGLRPLPPPPEVKVVAAAADTPDRWAVFSNAMAAEDDRFRTALAAVFATALRDALRRAGVKVAGKAQRKAASVRDAVQAAAETGVYPLELLRVVGVEDHRLFDNAFDGAAETAEQLLAEHQERRRRLTADQLGVAVDTLRETWEPVEEDRRRALAAWLPAALTAVAVERFTRGIVDTPGEQPVDPTVPGDLLAAAVRVSNGAQVRDGVVDTPAPGASPTAAGLVDTLVVDAVTAAGVLPLYEWVHGEPAVPFPPHVELDGAVWDDTQADAVLTNREPFPPFDFYFPGDHKGCLCSIRVVWREGMAGDFTPQDIIDGGGD